MTQTTKTQNLQRQIDNLTTDNCALRKRIDYYVTANENLHGRIDALQKDLDGTLTLLKKTQMNEVLLEERLNETQRNLTNALNAAKLHREAEQRYGKEVDQLKARLKELQTCPACGLAYTSSEAGRDALNALAWERWAKQNNEVEQLKEQIEAGLSAQGESIDGMGKMLGEIEERLEKLEKSFADAEDSRAPTSRNTQGRKPITNEYLNWLEGRIKEDRNSQPYHHGRDHTLSHCQSLIDWLRANNEENNNA